MADTPAEIAEQLREAALAAGAESWRRSDAHSLGIGANLACAAADIIERQASEITALRAEIEALRAETAWGPVDGEALLCGEPVALLLTDGRRNAGVYDPDDNSWCATDGFYMPSQVLAYAPLPSPPAEG